MLNTTVPKSRTTALKGFHGGYKGDKSSLFRDISDELINVQMIKDRDNDRVTWNTSDRIFSN